MRLKRVIEVRSADCVPPAAQMALPALISGLVRDPAALHDLERWVMGWEPEAVLEALKVLPVEGFRGRIGGHDALGVARDLLALAVDGLRRLEPEGLRYLEPLEERVRLGRTFAEETLTRLGPDLRQCTPEQLEIGLPTWIG